MRSTTRPPQPRERVRQLRERAGMSQAELARRAEISRSLMCEIEQGTRGITVRSLTKLCRALDVAPVEIDPATRLASAA